MFWVKLTRPANLDLYKKLTIFTQTRIYMLLKSRNLSFIYPYPDQTPLKATFWDIWLTGMENFAQLLVSLLNVIEGPWCCEYTDNIQKYHTNFKGYYSQCACYIEEANQKVGCYQHTMLFHSRHQPETVYWVSRKVAS